MELRWRVIEVQTEKDGFYYESRTLQFLSENGDWADVEDYFEDKVPYKEQE